MRKLKEKYFLLAQACSHLQTLLWYFHASLFWNIFITHITHIYLIFIFISQEKRGMVLGLNLPNSAIGDKHIHNNSYLVRVLCLFLISKCVVGATSAQLFLFGICLRYVTHYLRSEFRILVAQLGFNVTL